MHYKSRQNQGQFLVGQYGTSTLILKVAFIQKGLMRLSFLQTDEPNYFPELEFLCCSNAFFEHSEQLDVLILHDLSHLEWKKIKILAQENN